MARYMRSDLGRGHTNLRPPAVVGPGIAWHGPGTYLTSPNFVADRVRRRRPDSVLRPPRVVAPAPIPIFFGPSVVYWAAVKSKQNSGLSRRLPFSSILRDPVVIGASIAWYGPGLYLTRPTRGVTESQLQPPTVVQAAAGVFFGPTVTLALARRLIPKSHLLPPAVIGASRINPGLRVRLVFGTRGVAKSQLFPPATVAEIAVFFGPQIALAPQRRGEPRSQLRPAAVVFGAVEIYGPEVFLTRIRPVRTHPHLAAPADITEAGEFPVVRVHSTYSRRGVPKSRLEPPTVVFPFFARALPTALVRITPARTHPRLQPPAVVAPVVSYGPALELAPSTRGRPKSRLSPPTVIAITYVALYGPQVLLAPSQRRPAFSLLSTPVVIDASRVNPGLRIKLVFGPRSVAKSQLFPPTTTARVEIFFGPEISLAQSQRGHASHRLIPPVVVGAAVVYFGPLVTLAPSRRGKSLSGLGKPSFEQPEGPHGGVLISLAASFRGRPKSLLKRPALVAAVVVVYYGPQVSLAYHRRGRAKSRLSPPTILRTRGVLQINLTYSRRGKTRFFLKPPTVVRLAIEIYGPEIALARITPPPTISKLRPPTDVGDVTDIGFLKTHLSPSKRGRSTYFLQPPTVVAREYSLGPETHLAPSFRGKPRYALKPPTVVRAAFVARPIQVSLAQIIPPPVIALLKKPTVVGDPVAFYGPSIWITRIKPPTVIHFVITGEVRPFAPPHGDVCGFDISETFICFIELPQSQVVGGESTTTNTETTTASDSSISGGERSSGSTFGGDQEAN